MVFGVDFGLKRIGLAKITNNIVIPLQPIIRKNRLQASKEFHKILKTHLYHENISHALLVFGLPSFPESHKNSRDSMQSHKNLYCPREFNTNQPHTEMQRRIKHFLNLIHFNGQVIFIDESFSSYEAEQKLQDRISKTRKNSRKNGQIDSISACIILERYLAKQQALESLNTQDSHQTIQMPIDSHHATQHILQDNMFDSSNTSFFQNQPNNPLNLNPHKNHEK